LSSIAPAVFHVAPPSADTTSDRVLRLSSLLLSTTRIRPSGSTRPVSAAFEFASGVFTGGVQVAPASPVVVLITR